MSGIAARLPLAVRVSNARANRVASALPRCSAVFGPPRGGTQVPQRLLHCTDRFRKRLPGYAGKKARVGAQKTAVLPKETPMSVSELVPSRYYALLPPIPPTLAPPV